MHSFCSFGEQIKSLDSKEDANGENEFKFWGQTKNSICLYDQLNNVDENSERCLETVDFMYFNSTDAPIENFDAATGIMEFRPMNPDKKANIINNLLSNEVFSQQSVTFDFNDELSAKSYLTFNGVNIDSNKYVFIQSPNKLEWQLGLQTVVYGQVEAAGQEADAQSKQISTSENNVA